MKIISNIIQNIRRRLFNTVISNNLVYNTCWEDPRIDRELLDLDSTSNILMLTSAGDNALDYLLDNPQSIECVDFNPAQNALLELKKAFIQNGNYYLLWDFFGKGQKPGASIVYHQQLRPFLSANQQQYWDNNIVHFEQRPDNHSFYYSGTSGKVARFINNRIQKKGLMPAVHNLLSASNLEEQQYYFKEIEPQLWTPFSKWLIRRQTTMSMLGVPANQRKMIEKRYEQGLLEFIRKSLRHVFTKQPITDNYFWRVYLTGRYTTECCPNYLREQYFEILQKRINRIETHSLFLLDYLKQTSRTFSHFVLLDHQDWMAFSTPQKLTQEWRQLLEHAQSGTRIIFRSAMLNPTFIPDFVHEYVKFHPDWTKKLHKKDRVGTYESLHLATVL